MVFFSLLGQKNVSDMTYFLSSEAQKLNAFSVT